MTSHSFSRPSSSITTTNPPSLNACKAASIVSGSKIVRSTGLGFRVGRPLDTFPLIAGLEMAMLVGISRLLQYITLSVRVRGDHRGYVSRPIHSNPGQQLSERSFEGRLCKLHGVNSASGSRKTMIGPAGTGITFFAGKHNNTNTNCCPQPPSSLEQVFLSSVRLYIDFCNGLSSAVKMGF